MSVQDRSPIRSWIFIYLGLIASVIMAGQPVDAGESSLVPPADVKAIPDAPLMRRDI